MTTKTKKQSQGIVKAAEEKCHQLEQAADELHPLLVEWAQRHNLTNEDVVAVLSVFVDLVTCSQK